MGKPYWLTRYQVDETMSDFAEMAQRLRNAYRAGPVAPLRDGLSPVDVDGAYEVQSINTAHWLGQGRRIVGRKIGLTAKSVQQQLGVDRPDFGVLFADMQLEDGGTLPSEHLLQPKVEAEVAIILETDLPSTETTYNDVLRAAAWAVPALEIVDSRIADWKITFADTVADNASSAFFVLGKERISLKGLDLRTCGMAMEFDGEVVSHGAGVACLGHPLEAAAWLARTLAERGEPLKAGDVVLTGALGPMVPLRPGTYITASIGGLGTVGFTYSERSS